MNQIKLFLVLGFVALNLAVGLIVAVLRLPIYLDSIGIVMASVLLGWRWGLVVAILTVVVGTFTFNPYLFAYLGTAICIALVTAVLYHLRLFDTFMRSIVAGLLIAVIAALASAPITTFLFDGNTLAGVDAITAYLLSTGQNLMQSVLITGFTSEPVDKVIVAVVSYIALSGLPKGWLEKYHLNAIPRRAAS